MAPYTEEQDRAWIERRTTRPGPPAEPAKSLHPQVHALQHALAQLQAARYWPQADPEVQDAIRAAAAAIADELTHHVREDHEPDGPRAAGPAGETVTVAGNLAAEPRLDYRPVSRGFAISDGVPCPNCGYADGVVPRVGEPRAALTPSDVEALAAAEALAERRSGAGRAEMR